MNHLVIINFIMLFVMFSEKCKNYPRRLSSGNSDRSIVLILPHRFHHWIGIPIRNVVFLKIMIRSKNKIILKI